MSAENVLWGAPRIRSELALLGHDVAESTVAEYMAKRPDPSRRRTWRTFLANDMGVAAARDFFTVPTLTFKVLYVFLVPSHDRRRILHANVTAHPTAEWTAQQITEASPGDAEIPRYIHRDRASVYGEVFRRRIRAVGIGEILSAKQSPWQNAFGERVLGTIRRECTDHLIPAGQGHLRRVLREYVEYCNRARCHLSLDGNAPEPRIVEEGRGRVRAVPHLGGLHHRYTRAARAAVVRRVFSHVAHHGRGVAAPRAPAGRFGCGAKAAVLLR